MSDANIPYLRFADGSALTLDPNGNWTFYDKNGAAQATILQALGSVNLGGSGIGIPSVRAGTPSRQTAKTAAIANLATITVNTTDASYYVSANVLVTTSTTHAFTVTVAYTDEGNTARTATLSFQLVAGGTPITSIANANGAVPYMGVPQHIRCKASTTVVFATTGTFTTVTYNIEPFAMQIG